MEKRYYLLTLSFLFLLFAGCKKYGYEFENGYDEGSDSGEGTVDTALSFVDVSLYNKARIFPGLVGVNEPRLTDEEVSFDFNYQLSSDLMRVNVVPSGIHSTGLYAPAGELMKVIVPEGVYGLTLQIGAHMDDLSGKPSLRRDPVIYTVKEIYPGVNYLRNLYGGTIWIKTRAPIERPVTLTFTGPVKSPDFTLGESNDETWKTQVLNSTVPWLELKSKHTIFTLPRAQVARKINQGILNSPTELMKEWDRVYELDFYNWMGLTVDNPDPDHRAPDLPERGVLDIQPSAGYAHSGFPWVAQLDNYWVDEWTNIETIKGGGSWGSYHEVGHNYQSKIWSWAGLGETSNNLFVFKGAHRNHSFPTHAPIKEQFPLALEYAAGTGTKDFDANTDPFFKILPFVQLFNKATNPSTGEDGWGLMPYLYTRARNAPRISNNDQDRKDFLYEAVCDYTQTDYAPFFAAWGISISAQSKDAVRSKGYPNLALEIWKYNPITDTGGDTPVPALFHGVHLKGADAKGIVQDVSKYNFGVRPNKTIQLTIKTNPGNFYYPNILGKKESNLGGGGWQIFLAGSGWEFRANNLPGFMTGGQIADGEWHTITVVFDGDAYKIRTFTDGVLNKEATSNDNTLDTNFPLTLGQIQNYNSANADFLIKNVRIFDAALPTDFIAANGCKTTLDDTHPYYSSLIGFWKMDEPESSTIKEETGSGGDFVLQGPYYWDSFTDLPLSTCD